MRHSISSSDTPVSTSEISFAHRLTAGSVPLVAPEPEPVLPALPELPPVAPLAMPVQHVRTVGSLLEYVAETPVRLLAYFGLRRFLPKTR